MKYTYTFLLMLTMTMSMMAQQAGSSGNGASASAVAVDGDFSGRYCPGGRGACGFSRASSTTTANAEMTFDVNASVVQLSFYTDRMTLQEGESLFHDCSEQGHLDKQCFEIQSDYMIGLDILSQIPEAYTSGYLIKGSYPLTKDGSTWTATVNVALYE